MVDRIIKPAKKLRGVVRVPADKSITHRAMIIGSIARGRYSIHNPLYSADCVSTMNCLKSLGVRFCREGKNLDVESPGFENFKEPENILNAGNSGTTIRLMTGLLSASKFFSILAGDESLSNRPMKRVITPLRMMGGKVFARKDDSYPPIVILPAYDLKGINYAMDIPSAQVKSAILIAGLNAKGETIVHEKFKTRNHTELMLNYFNADIKEEGFTVKVSSSRLRPKVVYVPGDISSAVFLICSALLVKDSELVIKDVGVNPTRTYALDLLKRCGAKIEIKNISEKCGEKRGDIMVCSSELRSFEIKPEEIPFLIDEIPILAVCATQARGKSVIKGAQELKVKESDRIKAMVGELKKMGADVKEMPDGLIIKGPTKLKGSKIYSHKDHRIAMAMSVAGLCANKESVIQSSEWADVSFPNFFNILDKITGVP